jgi:hypothetical protein
MTAWPRAAVRCRLLYTQSNPLGALALGISGVQIIGFDNVGFNVGWPWMWSHPSAVG